MSSADFDLEIKNSQNAKTFGRNLFGAQQKDTKEANAHLALDKTTSLQ